MKQWYALYVFLYSFGKEMDILFHEKYQICSEDQGGIIKNEIKKTFFYLFF